MQGCKDYWSDLFIEWRTDAHLIQHCRQRISILQLPLYWNHGHCQEQNVLLHSLLGVSFTHIKGITSSKEMHYHLIYAELGSLFSPRFTCSCTLLTVGLIAWQPFYTPACFNCIIRSNVVILNTMKRHTCKIWLLIKQWTDDDGSYRRNMYLKVLSCFNTNELHYIVWHIVT